MDICRRLIDSVVLEMNDIREQKDLIAPPTLNGQSGRVIGSN